MKPLIDNRLRSVLLSVGACLALLAAYYMAIDHEPIPPQTEIVYQACLGVPCRPFRLKLDGDGAVTLGGGEAVYSYRVSTFAVRRVLRVFRRQAFLDRDVMAYGAAGGPACVLGLSENHRKTALTHVCGTRAPEIVKPLEALEQATRFRDIIAQNPAVMRDLQVRRRMP